MRQDAPWLVAMAAFAALELLWWTVAWSHGIAPSPRLGSYILFACAGLTAATLIRVASGASPLAAGRLSVVAATLLVAIAASLFLPLKFAIRTKCRSGSIARSLPPSARCWASIRGSRSIGGWVGCGPDGLALRRLLPVQSVMLFLIILARPSPAKSRALTAYSAAWFCSVWRPPRCSPRPVRCSTTGCSAATSSPPSARPSTAAGYGLPSPSPMACGRRSRPATRARLRAFGRAVTARGDFAMDLAHRADDGPALRPVRRGLFPAHLDRLGPAWLARCRGRPRGGPLRHAPQSGGWPTGASPLISYQLRQAGQRQPRTHCGQQQDPAVPGRYARWRRPGHHPDRQHAGRPAGDPNQPARR